ncbi:alpha/beta fold hydrolase [Sanguibacter suaedae]|uniref:Alpha/beta hydrolase n=1 Tax=Sanguibacter suaedae TaxID=2795737 RepID=A0A934I3R7_9MICO|nr:alpha/beta hydrolase [Sanguibacter suaedae]MBI9113686.1 alpha/beta hydrolase [Sanguibacter suaedae]
MQPLTIHRYGTPDAPTVVLVHGLTEAGTAWPDLVGRWCDGWDIHAPDLRGHGRSPRFRDDELESATEVLVADVVALVDSLPGPVALVGHSLGGLLALRTALARPDRVRGLVLEDPAEPSGDAPDPAFVAATEAFLDSMTAEIHDQDQTRRLERWASETGWSRAEVAAWAACKPLVDREYVRRGLWLGDQGWGELFDRLEVPTLVVVPEGSVMAPGPEALRNDKVRLVTVPDAGHCVRRDQPDRYHGVVDAFLEQASQPQAPRSGRSART